MRGVVVHFSLCGRKIGYSVTKLKSINRLGTVEFYRCMWYLLDIKCINIRLSSTIKVFSAFRPRGNDNLCDFMNDQYTNGM